MTTTHSAIAIGGPADGRTLMSQSLFLDVPTLDGGKFTYGWHSCAGVNYWTSSDMPLSAIMAKLIERYAQFRDFASGKTLEVINALADKVQELETRDSGWPAKVQHLQDKVDEQKILIEGRDQAIRAANEDNNGLIHEAREIRRMASNQNVRDDGATISGLVAKLCNELSIQREHVANVVATLKSTGHKHEGRPLSDLVDIAIDRERNRHLQSLIMIADVCGISFAIGGSPEAMTDVILNSLRSRQEKKLVAMQAEPDGEECEPFHRIDLRAAAQSSTVEGRLGILERRFNSLNRWTQHVQLDPKLQGR